MRVTLVFDHYFQRDKEGKVFSNKNYNYEFLRKRYLQVFDHLTVLARASDQPDSKSSDVHTEGEGVEFISIGNWRGPLQYLLTERQVKQNLYNSLADDSAVIMINGILSTTNYQHFLQQNRPYALEVGTDPYDQFAMGAVKHPLRAFFRFWLTRSLRLQCENAASVSYVTKFALQKRYPPGPNTFAVACSDVVTPDAAFVAEPRTIDASKSAFTLINVGFLSQLYKGTDILISAVAQCINGGLELNLVIVGDGKYRPQLEQQARTLGIENHVRFLGQLPAGTAIRQQLDSADLFALPSRQEGLPRALVEAMARGLPAIGSTVGGIPELLEADEMIPPGNVEALAQKIRDVVTNPSRMQTMSARNLLKARDYHEDNLQRYHIEFHRNIVATTQAWLTKKC